MNQEVIIKFEQVDEQTYGPIKRIIGLVKANYLFGLFDSSDLSANPRLAETSRITNAIVESIENNSDLFAFKTKGILLGASVYQSLDRQRYKLEFQDIKAEGILDGGHNMLAIGLHIANVIRQLPDINELNAKKAPKKIKTWEDLKLFWLEENKLIRERKDLFEFLVPVETIVPADGYDNEEFISEFLSSLRQICEARNNNAQLADATMDNQLGYYNELRSALDPEVEKKVEWKSNTPGATIDVGEVVALTWVPLNKLQLPSGASKISPNDIYNSPGNCIKLFGKLMETKDVGIKQGGSFDLQNEPIKSAVKMVADLVNLHEQIYEDFPHAYNSAGGKFGRIDCVKQWKPDSKGKRFATLFKSKPVEYKYPDAFIMPIVYGLQALMTVNNDGTIKWSTDPFKFVKKNLDEVAMVHRMAIEMAGYNPQTVGKSTPAYHNMVNTFENILLKQDKGLAA